MAIQTMKTLEHILKRNQQWAAAVTDKDPAFFSDLSNQQSPEYLWIGCSDSRVPANQIIGLPPGEVFVHRNIANLVVHSDLNCLSVIQYAVEILNVKHIIVCGHYGCGGIRAAVEDKQLGLIDNWLSYIRDVRRFHSSELEKLQGDEELDALCELNVVEQVTNVCNTAFVQDAWRRGDELFVHGWIYDIENGLLQNLGTREAPQE